MSVVVPSGKRWIVKGVSAVLPAAAGAPYVVLVAAGVTFAIAQQPSASAPVSFSQQTFQVVNAGETLTASSSSSSFTWAIYVSGYELDA